MALKILLSVSRMQYNYPKFLQKSNSSLRYIEREKPTFKTSEKKKNIRFYFLHRYVEYINKYILLEKRFPKAVSIYRVFTIGIKEFYRDIIEYMKIIKIVTMKNGIKSLTRRELELYEKMPKDIVKISPVLLISALPFANYVIFPIAFMYPRQLLTSHFWNFEQKVQFKTMDLTRKLDQYKPILSRVKCHSTYLEQHAKYECWKRVLSSLESGSQPLASDIVACKCLFSARPYHLIYLSRNHVSYLLKLHDIHRGWFRRDRLADRAMLLHHMDMAIGMEGGVHNLPSDALRNACLLRGLNPANMKSEDMVSWLSQWMEISRAVDKTCWSLLLHAPILLGYNQSSNWQLIYTQNK